MNKIEELIEQLCPNGVEFKELGEVCEFQRGRTITQRDAIDGEVPVIAGGQNPSYYHNTPNRTGETIAVSGSGAYAGFVSYWTIPVFLSDSFSINPNNLLFPKYVFYFLKSIQEIIHATKKGSGVPHVHGSSIAKIQIPIPPLAIQQEIVSILDKFTQLQAELQAELQARSRQYEYYRNELLNFEGKDIEWKMLGELCTIGDGLHGTPKYDDSGEYFFINGNNLDNGKISFDGKTKKVNDFMYQKYGIPFTRENTVFMSINGTIGSVSFYNNEKIVLGKSVAFFIIKSNCLNTRFLFYLLQSDFSKNYFEAQKTGSTIKNLGLKALRTFLIPIPPISVQVRIAGVLDKFDAMVNDLSVGLPAEIAARRKQYEYYRGKLLSFKAVSD